MDRRTKIALIAGFSFFALVLLWWLKPTSTGEHSGNGGSKVKKLPTYVSSSWDKKYELDSKDPYGLFLFNFLVGANQNKGKDIERIDSPEQLDSLLTSTAASFVFIGDEFILQQKEIDQMISAVNNGSTVFVSSYFIDDKFMAELFESYQITFAYALKLKVQDDHNTKFSLAHVYQNDTVANSWYGFKKYTENDRFETQALLYNKQFTSVLQFKIGKGQIIVNHSPELFLNYQLKSKDGFTISKNLISGFNPDHNTYWLEIARFKEYDENWDEEESGEDNSLLQFIFQNPYLFQAMMWTLVGVILFLLFRTKRLRPVVPPHVPKKNMTLSFVEAISSIYFSKRSPFALLQVQRKNFYDTVYRHFLVDLSRVDRDREIATLAEKSEFPMNELRHLIAKMEVSNEIGVDDTYNVEIAKSQRNFYLHSGIVSEKVKTKIDARDNAFHRSIAFSSILLLAGFMSLIGGMYLLIQGFGAGILFWPLAILFITWGILRFSRPLLSISSSYIKYYPLLGKVKEYPKEELRSMENDPKGFKMTFNTGSSIVVRYSQLSNIDGKQLHKIIEKQVKLRL